MKKLVVITILLIGFGIVAWVVNNNYGPPKADKLRVQISVLQSSLDSADVHLQEARNKIRQNGIKNLPIVTDFAFYSGVSDPVIILGYEGEGTTGIIQRIYYTSNTNESGFSDRIGGFFGEVLNDMGWTGYYNKDRELGQWDLLKLGENFLFLHFTLLDDVGTIVSIEPTDTNVGQVARRIRDIAYNTNLTESQKRDELNKTISTTSPSIITKALKILPIYNERNKRITTFDSYARSLLNSGGNISDVLSKDPIRALLEIGINPSPEKIKKYLGIP